MACDPGTLSALADATGENEALAAELRAMFVESASVLAGLMRRSRCDANWRAAAWRLHGLAASFAADGLMALAAEGAAAAPGDPAVLRRIEAEIAGFGG